MCNIGKDSLVQSFVAFDVLFFSYLVFYLVYLVSFSECGSNELLRDTFFLFILNSCFF